MLNFVGYISLIGLGMLGKQIVCEPSDTIDFFPNIKDNLTKLSWAHAVNDARYLEEVLSGDIMMIEADIILGTLIDDPSNLQPVMGHPPAQTSDISLQQFLQRINEFNTQTTVSKKGVKLDFKSIEVFEMSLHIIEKLYQEVSYPVWINADILPGPVNSQVKPVNASRFLRGAGPYSKTMLSTGWTTLYGGNIVEGTYTSEQLNEMVSTLMDNDVEQKVTFPVRAGIAANSKEGLIKLLKETSSKFDSTLTIWSSQGDFVNIDSLKKLILECGLNRIYLDVPKEVSDQLHLDS
ncbi:protein FAM151B isoform X1 [Arctopsyche grandis]|uniref:protein FAM151B isoform X1 n=1 Tax=Arctopsyche grandis TaxID=121162 RepID=UPI00406D88EE